MSDDLVVEVRLSFAVPKGVDPDEFGERVLRLVEQMPMVSTRSDYLLVLADPPPVVAEHVDSFGRRWPATTILESCSTCGQPDNCGECNHEPLTMEDVLLLGGRLPPEPQLPFTEEP